MAQERTSFRSHLATYLVVIGFLWGLWFITGTVSYERSGVPWPTWAMLGWGTGLVFHYLNAYGRRGGYSAVEKSTKNYKNEKTDNMKKLLFSLTIFLGSLASLMAQSDRYSKAMQDRIAAVDSVRNPQDCRIFPPLSNASAKPKKHSGCRIIMPHLRRSMPLT
jgi:hypothetical protein